MEVIPFMIDYCLSVPPNSYRYDLGVNCLVYYIQCFTKLHVFINYIFSKKSRWAFSHFLNLNCFYLWINLYTKNVSIFMAQFNPVIEVKNDGLYLPKAVGPWAEMKYSLMGGYAYIFNNAIKNRFTNRVYIDLFAAAGYVPIKGRNKILKSSALIALALPQPFTHYIFCEMDPDRMNALKERVKREHPDKFSACCFIQGDSNVNVSEVIRIVNRLQGSTISFAFIDPFSLNLHFSTVEKLSRIGKVDFLILLALQMDANRNFIHYSDEDNQKVDLFVGRNNWREPFKNMEVSRKDFIGYLAKIYDQNMDRLGYIVNEGLKPKVDAEEYNLALYYLAFYSKHELGNKFFKEIQKYHISQQPLF